MKAFLDLITIFITNPINIGLVIAFNLTTLVLLSLGFFLPESMLIKYNLNVFFTNHFSNVLIVFLISFFLFITQMVSVFLKKNKKRKESKRYTKQTQGLLDDAGCREILLKVYQGNGHPVFLHETHQKVMQLRTTGMIVRTTSQIIAPRSDMNNPKFPYVLQPWVEDYIRENLNITLKKEEE